MKISSFFCLLCLLGLNTSVVFAKDFACKNPSGNSFYEITLTANTPGSLTEKPVPFGAKLFTYDTLTKKMKLDKPASCQPSTKAATLSTEPELKASCWVAYGPDGGQNIDIYLDINGGIAARYFVNLTPMGPTGPGKAERMECE